MRNSIRLFWWSEPKLMGKAQENYGDFIGAYLATKLSNKDIKFANPKKISIRDLWDPIYVTAGSVLAHVNRKCIVWGSGIIKEDQQVKPAKFLAVRGPETRRVLTDQGYEVPEVYGDPALLLPLFYNPPISKKYSLGIIPHYVDYKEVKIKYSGNSDVRVINLMTNDIELTTNEILECERIISSSLHGLIVAHAYGIPAIWIQFSKRLFGDNIKFRDYFKSVGIPEYQITPQSVLLSYQDFDSYFESNTSLPNGERIRELQNGLLVSCPFRN